MEISMLEAVLGIPNTIRFLSASRDSFLICFQVGSGLRLGGALRIRMCGTLGCDVSDDEDASLGGDAGGGYVWPDGHLGCGTTTGAGGAGEVGA